MTYDPSGILKIKGRVGLAAHLNQKKMLASVRGFLSFRPVGFGLSSFGAPLPQLAYTRCDVMQNRIPASVSFSPGPSSLIISSCPRYVQITHGSEIASASQGSICFRSRMICNAALHASMTCHIYL